jgi:hypothetical protein
VASTGILKFNSDIEGNVSLLKACQHLLTFVEMPVTCVIFDTSSRLAFFLRVSSSLAKLFAPPRKQKIKIRKALAPMVCAHLLPGLNCSVYIV